MITSDSGALAQGVAPINANDQPASTHTHFKRCNIESYLSPSSDWVTTDDELVFVKLERYMTHNFISKILKVNKSYINGLSGYPLRGGFCPDRSPIAPTNNVDEAVNKPRTSKPGCDNATLQISLAYPSGESYAKRAQSLEKDATLGCVETNAALRREAIKMSLTLSGRATHAIAEAKLDQTSSTGNLERELSASESWIGAIRCPNPTPANGILKWCRAYIMLNKDFSAHVVTASPYEVGREPYLERLKFVRLKACSLLSICEE